MKHELALLGDKIDWEMGKFTIVRCFYGWINNDFYCIQLFESKFGISRVTEEIDFSTIPDKTYTEWRSFKTELEKVINEQT